MRPLKGFENMRNLSRRESKLTGLSASTLIITDRNTGLLTFWKRLKSGLSNLSPSAEWRREKEDILKNYWETKKC